MKRILALSVLVPALALADEAAPAPATHTKVVGVILSTSQALVWDDEKNEYALRRVGETLDGARIVALESDRVVVDREGVRGEVELGGAPIKAPRRAKRMPAVIIGALPDAAAPATAAPAAAPAPAAPATPAAPAPAAAAPLIVNVPPAAPAPAPAAAPPPVVAAPAAPPPVVAAPAAQPPQPEDDEVEATVIPRLDLDRELGNFDSLSRQAQVAPAQGATGGFALVQIRPGSFVSRVGLRAGDIILRIDGRPINKVEDAAAAYSWLRVTDRFTVDVLRAGQPMRLHYIIAPTATRSTR